MAGAREVDVLIVGGGFTGLAAARELRQASVDFLLVDGFGDHLGGRAYSFDSPVGEGLRFDHGAQYVGDLQNTIMAEVRELLEPEELVNGAAQRLPYPWEVMVLGRQRMAFESTSSLFGIPGAPPQVGLAGAEPPRREPLEAPPAPATVAPERMATTLAALRAGIEGLSDESLVERAAQARAAGGRGRVSWLREQLEAALRGAGALGDASHPRDTLVAVRDVAVALVGALRGPSDETLEAYAAAIDERLGALFGRGHDGEAC